MSGGTPLAFWGLKVPAGDELTMVSSEIPGIHLFRITMAAIDPSAKALEADQPKRATLKLIRRPLEHDDYDNEDAEDDDEDEEEMKKIQKKAKKVKKAAKENEMEVDGSAEDGDEDEEDEDSDDDEPIETEEFVICTLDPERQYQQTLDIVIAEYEEAFFKVHGNFDVYLTGNYIVPAEDRKDDFSGEEDDSDDDYDLSPDEDELRGMLGGDVESEDELDDVENPRITEIESKDEKKPVEKKPVEEKPVEKKLTKAEKKSGKRVAEEEAKPEESKPSKKQRKKQKANDGKAIDAASDTPEPAKRKVQFAKPIEQAPINSTKKTPEKAESQSKVVQGVTIEDKKRGTGPTAKGGNRLGMRYIGKLNNGKVFDSNTKGKAFTFRLGKGEVIKGWDVGLVGMQVGGERRIIIPPGLAYGKKQLPGIPSNSTLTFDVKLIEIK